MITMFDKYFDTFNAPDDMRERIIGELSRPERHYHGLRHHEHMFSILEKTCPAREIFAAVFYHDLVYNPRWRDNEEKSAELARKELRGMVNTDMVSDLIMATKYHKSHGIYPIDEFLKADLAILVTDLEIYQEYAKNIRIEFQHVDDQSYSLGRREVLRHLALTDLFQSPRDKAALDRNIEWEIRSL